MVGAIGALTCFSFYPNKNMTTVEGGMVTTTRADWADQLKVYRLHGLSRHAWQRYQARQLVLSDAIVAGFKYNLTDIQSALGLAQLRQLEDFLARREEYARVYDEAFASLEGVRTQPRPSGPDDRHALHLYVLLLDPQRFRGDRNEIINALLTENVGAALHYRALHTHPLYREMLGHAPAYFPHALAVGQSILSLPLSPAMSRDDVADVIEAVHKVLAAFRR